MGLSTEMLIDLVAKELITPGENKRGPITNQLRQQIKFGDGVTSGEVDRAYSRRGLINQGGSDDLDLAGALLDSFGATITFSKMKLIAFRNRSTVAGDILRVGPQGIANAFSGFWLDASDGCSVHPGVAVDDLGWLVLYAPEGLAVVGGSSDVLGVRDVGATSIDYGYDVLLLGTSS